jgi:hypothetical protein
MRQTLGEKIAVWDAWLLELQSDFLLNRKEASLGWLGSAQGWLGSSQGWLDSSQGWLGSSQDCIDRKDKNDVLIIGVDANAALGVRKAPDGINWRAGWHGLHRVNAAGKRLQHFFGSRRLVAAPKHAFRRSATAHGCTLQRSSCARWTT